jgi:hypothetical protein
LSQGFRKNATPDLGIQCGRSSRSSAAVLGVKAIGAVAPISIPKLVVERASNACLSAGGTEVAEFFRSTEEWKALKVYLLFEGHRDPSLVAVW